MAANKQGQQLSNNNLIIVMVLITLLVLGVTAYVAKTLIADISLNATVIGLKSKADSQVKQDVTAAPNLVDSFNNLGASANVLSDALPGTADFPSLIVEMENIANDAGVSLKTVNPQAAGGIGTQAAAPVASAAASTATSSSSVAAPIPQAFPFSIEVNGSYASMLKVFSDLEVSARPMRVTGVQLSGSGSSMSAQIYINTYYQSAATLPFGTEAVK